MSEYEQLAKEKTKTNMEKHLYSNENADINSNEIINHKQDDTIDDLLENNLYVWSLLLYTKK
ncbi:MAG TPA: hypothetical protein VGQ09_09735 [Chitinophagaceae bacterium]|jgi:hypothetical protein|nr:hypothetical protein [Chitinophagaceae bacterium]